MFSFLDETDWFMDPLAAIILVHSQLPVKSSSYTGSGFFLPHAPSILQVQ